MALAIFVVEREKAYFSWLHAHEEYRQNAFLFSSTGQTPTRTRKVCVPGAPTAEMI